MTVHFANGRLKLLGSGSALPGASVDNATLMTHLANACGDKMARKARAFARQLGIESRFLSRRLDQSISTPTPSAIDLSEESIQQALEEAGHPASGFLVTHTATPHTLLPSGAAWIADRLRLPCPYMELRQACTGFANALQIAQSMLGNNQALKPIILSGSEVGSVFFDISPEFIDINQLVNFVQMGDGSGSVVVSQDDGSSEQIISHCFTGHIGLGQEPGFQLQGASSANPVCEQGLPAFEHNPLAVRKLGPELFIKGLKAIFEQGFTLDDFAFILPHQANGHIDNQLSRHLGISKDRVVNDARQLGNLGSAAIWVSFDRLRNSGKLKRGDKVLILGAESTKYMYGGFIYTH
ncbi:3-oxoacyl-ACP synthase III family protein [Endozoicomonas arenosclerae]|uniref:3-oxoacyl-ACP synthase III family protein n=1 Tax=Endozoicomonas arenosclerae TaxID=1633495 RepID=UPI0007808D90|nr:3-oxoacyl-[acyl-carrier-protein] synthase III C-terminal domain-containing protein [Endozoicomonas arenosclerae]